MCGVGGLGQFIVLIFLFILSHFYNARPKVLVRLRLAFIQFILLLSLFMYRLKGPYRMLLVLLFLFLRQLAIETVAVVHFKSLSRLLIIDYVRDCICMGGFLINHLDADEVIFCEALYLIIVGVLVNGRTVWLGGLEYEWLRKKLSCFIRSLGAEKFH